MATMTIDDIDDNDDDDDDDDDVNVDSILSSKIDVLATKKQTELNSFNKLLNIN